MLLHNRFVQFLRRKSTAEWGILVLRIVLGTIFVYHGWPKLFNDTASMTAFFRNIGIPMASAAVTLVGVVEFACGILLLLGLLARPAALLLLVDMVVVIFKARGLSSWTGIEFEVLISAATIYFILAGAGETSLDALIVAKTTKEHESELPVASPKP